MSTTTACPLCTAKSAFVAEVQAERGITHPKAQHAADCIIRARSVPDILTGPSHNLAWEMIHLAHGDPADACTACSPS